MPFLSEEVYRGHCKYQSCDPLVAIFFHNKKCFQKFQSFQSILQGKISHVSTKHPCNNVHEYF